MATTPNMGLTVWTGGSDLFNHTQLADNFAALDIHDHSSGKGVPITEQGIANLAVTNGKLGANSVTGDKIADASVGATELATNAVTTAAINAQAVTQAKIGVLPGSRVFAGTDFSIPNNADTAVQFSAANYNNPSSMWTVANSTRMYMPVNGVYIVNAGVKWDAGASGIRSVKLLLNGTTVIAGSDRGAATGAVYNNISTNVNLAALDYLELIVYQNNGGSVLLKAFDRLPYLSAQWVSA